MAPNYRRLDEPLGGADTDGKEIGAPHPYGNQFRHDEDAGVDQPIGLDPNAAGHSPVFPDWWNTGGSGEGS